MAEPACDQQWLAPRRSLVPPAWFRGCAVEAALEVDLRVGWDCRKCRLGGIERAVGGARREVDGDQPLDDCTDRMAVAQDGVGSTVEHRPQALLVDLGWLRSSEQPDERQEHCPDQLEPVRVPG